MTSKSATPTVDHPTPEHLTHAAPLRPRRQPKWIIGGALSMAVGALGAAWLWQQATGTHQVIYVAQSVSVGEVIEAGDLTTVQVGRLPDVATVPGDELAALIGQQAMVTLPSGTLLPGGVIGELPLASSESQLGLRLASGRLPTTGLEPGSMVSVVTLPDPSGQSAESELPASTPARLITPPSRDEDGLSWLIDVAVPTESAEELAQLAAVDRVAVVLAGR